MSVTSGCAACKYFRRSCLSDCIFSHYFPANDHKRFAWVHKIYGFSNVGKMLQQLPVQLRAEAAQCITFEAQCRVEDPIYGCVGIISLLHQQIHIAESQLAKARAEIAVLNSHDAQQELQVQEINKSAGLINTIDSKQGNYAQFGPYN